MEVEGFSETSVISTALHGVILYKSVTFILTAMKTPNLTQF
jgi:hypothetical protein